MMKRSLLMAVALVSGLAGAVEVQLLHYQVGKELGEELPFEVKPMGYEPGAKVSLLLTGEKMIAVKDDSVKIESFRDAGGKELSKSKLGREAWSQEPFAKVTPDGKLGSFTVSFQGDFVGKLERSELKGTVDILTGSQKAEDKVVLKKGDAKGVKAGPLEVKLVSGKKSLFGAAQEGITVEGDHVLLEKLEIEVDGKKEESRNSSWSGDEKTFYFEGKLPDEVTVHLVRWTDLKPETVPFRVRLVPGK